VQIEFRQWLCGLVRQGVRVVIEEVMQDELTAMLDAQRHERTRRRTGQRNGSYRRDLVTPVGVIEDVQVPRDRAGRFETQVFERYARRAVNLRQQRTTHLRPRRTTKTPR
jgi:transposase-like protein